MADVVSSEQACSFSTLIWRAGEHTVPGLPDISTWNQPLQLQCVVMRTGSSNKVFVYYSVAESLFSAQPFAVHSLQLVLHVSLKLEASLNFSTLTLTAFYLTNHLRVKEASSHDACDWKRRNNVVTLYAMWTIPKCQEMCTVSVLIFYFLYYGRLTLLTIVGIFFFFWA